MRNYSIIFIICLALNACGGKTVDLNELETFFRGRTILFDNDYGNSCQRTLEKTDIGLEIHHSLFPDLIERYSFSDFEIINKNVFGLPSKYFKIGDFEVIQNDNFVYMISDQYGYCVQNYSIE